MEVPKNSFACAICQKTFTNPLILIKHVEFRHSSAKPSQNSNIGSVPKDQDIIINNNQDPLETYEDISVAPFEFVPIQEILENGSFEKNEVRAKKVTDSFSENPAIDDFNFVDHPIKIERRNNENISKICADNRNNLAVIQNKTITNQNTSASLQKKVIY